MHNFSDLFEASDTLPTAASIEEALCCLQSDERRWPESAFLFSLASDYGLNVELYACCEDIVDACAAPDPSGLSRCSPRERLSLNAQIYLAHLDSLRRRDLARHRDFAQALTRATEAFLVGHGESILGLHSFFDQDIAKALLRFRTSREAFMTSQSNADALKAAIREATVARELWNSEQVIAYVETAIELAKSAGLRCVFHRIALQSLLGGVLLRGDRAKAAESLLASTAKLALNAPLVPISAQAFYEYGYLLAERHRYAQAVPWLKRAEPFFAKSRQPTTLAVQMVLLECYLALGDLNAALDCSETIERIPLEISMPSDFFDAALSCAKLAVKLYLPERAERWIMRAMSVGLEDKEAVIGSVRKLVETARAQIASAKSGPALANFPFLDCPQFFNVIVNAHRGEVVTLGMNQAVRCFTFKENSGARELLLSLVQSRIEGNAKWVPQTRQLSLAERQRFERAKERLLNDELIYVYENGSIVFAPRGAVTFIAQG